MENVDAFRLDGKGEYRTQEELADIEAVVRSRAEEMSNDFLDELEAKGIATPEEYKEKPQILEETLRAYLDKFLQWLHEQ